MGKKNTVNEMSFIGRYGKKLLKSVSRWIISL